MTIFIQQARFMSAALLIALGLSACSSGGGGGATTTYTIGGNISGLSGSGLVLQNNGGNNLSVSAAATNFSFTTAIASGGAYNVSVLTQPSTPSQSCKVVNGAGTVSANVTNIIITCIPKNDHVSRNSGDTVFGTYYDSIFPVMSPDGRYVVYESSAILASGANGQRQIFLRDRQTNQTELISVDTAGTAGNSSSYAPAISSDGRYVVFESTSTNLVTGDLNGASDIFLRDRQAGTTTRVSVGASSVEANGASAQASLSADGRYLAFYSYASNLMATATTNGNVFLRDLQSGSNTLVSVAPGGAAGNGVSSSPSISADGSRIAFWSYASNLVASDANGLWDIFLYDSNASIKISLVSVATDGTQKNQGNDSISRVVQPTISADGNVVAFSTTATNLVAGDTNAMQDVFIRKISTGVTTRVSVGTGGVQSDLNSPILQGERIALSNDGTWVAFSTSSTNIAAGGSNVLLRNVATDGTVQITTAGNSGDKGPAISGDGRFVAFGSASPLDTRFVSSGLFVQDRTSP